MKNSFAQRKSGALDKLCLGVIAFYQRHISPRKGWRCAYSRLHGGAGCSGFARATIENQGLKAATPQVWSRFRACKMAAQMLRAEKSNDSPEPGFEARKSKAKSRSGGGICDALWIMPDGFCCAEAACEGAACADIGCAEAACGCLPCL